MPFNCLTQHFKVTKSPANGGGIASATHGMNEERNGQPVVEDVERYAPEDRHRPSHGQRGHLADVGLPQRTVCGAGGRNEINHVAGHITCVSE